MLKIQGVLASAALGATVLVAGNAQASLIWTAGNTQSTFKSVEFQDNNNNFHSTNGSSLTFVTDATYGGVWHFHKDDLDRRAEAKGAANFTPAMGATYYIGWRFKMGSTRNNNSIFQWKSYGSPMVQNYPVVIKLINNQLVLQYYSPGQNANNLWQRDISANTWYDMALKIKVSDQTSGGNIQFWWHGVAQTLTGGSTTYVGKTFDGNDVEPKWGYYGETNTNEDTWVGQLKIGTALADVNLTSGTTPTPTPTPTPTSGTNVEITPAGSAVTASTNDGNVPANAVDNNLSTRWSGNGDGAWLQLDLGTARTISHVKAAFLNGDTRTNRFDIQVSNGSGVWTTVFSGSSSGTTLALQTFDFADTSARWVRYVGHGNSVNLWNSITEIEVWGR